MNIPYFNQEHYADPTAYEALKNIEAERKALRAFRPIVYICSPFAGDVEGNITVNEKAGQWTLNSGKNEFDKAVSNGNKFVAVKVAKSEFASEDSFMDFSKIK